MDADGTRHLGDPAHRLFDVPGGHHHQVVQLVDDDQDEWQPREPAVRLVVIVHFLVRPLHAESVGLFVLGKIT